MLITIRSKEADTTLKLLWIFTRVENDGIKIIRINDNDESLGKLITIRSEDTDVGEDLLWILKRFENDGVKVIEISDNDEGLGKLFKKHKEERTNNNKSNVITSTEVEDEDKNSNESSKSTTRQELETKLTELLTKNKGKFSNRISYETFLKNIKTNELEALIEITEFIVNRNYSFVMYVDTSNVPDHVAIRIFDELDESDAEEITHELYKVSEDILSKHNAEKFRIMYTVN